MAAKKEAKATKVVAKKDVKVDYSAMDVAELNKVLAEKQNDILESKRSHRSGELVNPRVLASHRKEVARILTAINAQKESK